MFQEFDWVQETYAEPGDGGVEGDFWVGAEGGLPGGAIGDAEVEAEGLAGSAVHVANQLAGGI